jgi:hypothetical protein
MNYRAESIAAFGRTGNRVGDGPFIGWTHTEAELFCSVDVRILLSVAVG